MNKFICWLTGLPSTNTVSSATKFVIVQGSSALTVAWSDLLLALQASLTVPIATPKTVEVGADYTLDGTEDVVICHGALQITYENKVDTVRPHIIRAVGGNVTIISDAASEETTLIVSGQSVYTVYSSTTDEWLDI